MVSKFKFKEYCPLVFKNLRERFGVKEALFNQALSSCEPYFEVKFFGGLTFNIDGKY